MSSACGRGSSRRALPLLFVCIAALLTACGGAPAPAASGTKPTQTPAGGGPDDEFDVRGAFEQAVVRLQALDAWRYTSAVNGVGLTPREVTLVGVERRKPVAARSVDYADATGQYTFVYIDGKAWRTGSTEDTISKRFVVFPAGPGNGSKDDPFAIESWWPFVFSAHKYFTVVGEEPIAGVAARHFQFTDEKGREQYLRSGKVAAADWTADVWLAKDAGHVLKVAFGGPIVAGGPRDDSQFAYEVSDIGCACPIEPPATVVP